MRALFLVALLVSATALAALIPTSSEATPSRESAARPWPLGLNGPFEVRETQHIRVASWDGTELDGWLIFPDTPQGVRNPVVLHMSPYFGFLTPQPDDREAWHNPIVSQGWGVTDSEDVMPLFTLVEQGYVVAAFNLRGTGHSDGCFEDLGPNEEKDTEFMIGWLASQPWSNGRVGMVGLSQMSATALHGAVTRPPALKTIVLSGILDDYYNYMHTPQGAGFAAGDGGIYVALVSGAPAIEGDLTRVAEQPARVPARVCDTTFQDASIVALEKTSDTRNAEFWEPRSTRDRLGDITIPVLMTQGFRDLWGSGHAFQDSLMWELLENAPKWQYEGQWGHAWPHGPGAADWNTMLISWLDHWLKGIGPVPARLGVVDYQDSLYRWHESAAWPPVEAVQEAIHLDGTRLTGTQGASAATFRALPYADPDENDVPRQLCTGHGSLVLRTGPLDEDVLIAGNPFAYLTVISDRPSGILAVHVYDLGPDFTCDEQQKPVNGVRIAMGAADLRFHKGGFQGEAFPVGTPTAVRIDITNMAEVIQAGHELAIVVSGGNLAKRLGQPDIPATFTLMPESHFVLPIVEGTLGGVETGIAYPERPR